MMQDARAAQPAGHAAGQEWIDESSARHQAPPRGDPWWRRGRAGELVERWVPGGARTITRRRAPVALLAGLTLGASIAVGVALSSGGEHEPPSHLPAAVDSSAPSGPPATGGGPMVISVVGRVIRPGLVTLPDGARVADALAAAGGPTPGADLGALNVARRLTDGEQIYVGIPAPPDAAAPAATPGAAAKIDLNAASVAQLDTLPGVGSVTAQRIVDWRTKHGRFARVEQLRDVDGIGPARFGQLKDLVVVR
jgi:competence protein ComEA